MKTHKEPERLGLPTTDEIVAEIVEFVNNAADEDDLRDLHNYIWPPEDETE